MSTTGNAQIIRCANCGANNRIDAAKQSDGREPICGRCKKPLTGAAASAASHPVIITDQNFGAEIERSPLPVLVDFWAAWCGPCRMIAPVIEQLAKELSGKVRVGKLDVDQNQMTAARFNVQSIPTLLVIKDGREVDRLIGAQSREAILQRLQRYL